MKLLDPDMTRGRVEHNPLIVNSARLAVPRQPRDLAIQVTKAEPIGALAAHDYLHVDLPLTDKVPYTEEPYLPISSEQNGPNGGGR